MLRKNVVLLMSLLTLVFASQALAADKLVNGIDANFPPFAYIDKTGEPSGFDVEAMNWIAKEIGAEVSHQPIEWDGIITSLLTKKIDIIASGMSITPERAMKVDFSNPYWVIKQVMVTKKDSALTIDELLKGKKAIGVQQGTSEAKWLKAEAAAKGWDFELRYYSSSPLAVEDVLNGRIDAAAMDDAPAKDAVSKKDVQIVGTFGMHDEEFGYAVRKDDKELLEKVNNALAKLMASPDWNELIKKYELDK
ncbi:ABC transporter substrate-binding protein [Desulforhopalus sp. IMCC35007]|uniref:ABC transporter substrate-binding protein n=1 Tax=Desulforhopalus sp. IMCC35007 TaxID=2569543 RepID=UPI0010AE3D19|nr:ABC transporter substrate-binding protein [Desulforhopalus sp. IMCC35007]TKB10689.1 amino acid ABC transporter substrate-binding protein [Desulforhopalus sp. IMCC35007]